MPSLRPLITLVYPSYHTLAGSIQCIPLKARSLLIKQCQSQTDFSPEFSPDCTLFRMLRGFGPVAIPDPSNLRNSVAQVPLEYFLHFHHVSVRDPLRSAIVLDLLRGCPVMKHDIENFRMEGWVKEIYLAVNPGRTPEVNFRPFFEYSLEPIHPDLPHDVFNIARIRLRLQTFRRAIIDKKPRFYPRSTHKNMSRSTRRHFEEIFGEGLLEDIPIFGQDDWQRVYHEHGIMLEGDVEFRQKWYPSGAKPRTYAAMGGASYRDCRHLQDFFTSLTDIFQSTNRRTRLLPSRLYIPPDADHEFYRIYDLASFTSNMVEQRNFCEQLALFFDGVMVEVVDEYYGIIERDLGEMLREYNATCVEGPVVSAERSPLSCPELDAISHARASLLGIFGNLMTCTVAHYLIMSTVVEEPEKELNIAGDDGLVRISGINEGFAHRAINLVGEWELSKTFMSTEFAAICLKRPIEELESSLRLRHNLVPPTLASCVAYLLGEEFDPRYQFYGLQDLSLAKRVTIVGTDLMRFLRSAWTWQHEDIGEVDSIWRGYTSLVERVVRKNIAHYVSEEWPNVLWPIRPHDYEFYQEDPLIVWARLHSREFDFQERGYEAFNAEDLRFAGQSVRCNWDKRLALLEKLGYVEKEGVSVKLHEQAALDFWRMLVSKTPLPPGVYVYTCLRDIPDHFVFE